MFAKIIIDSALDLLIKKIQDNPTGKASKFIRSITSEDMQAKFAKAFGPYMAIAEEIEGDDV